MFWSNLSRQFFSANYIVVLEARRQVRLQTIQHSKISDIYHNCYLIPPPNSTKIFHVGKITKMRKEANKEKTRIELGTSITVKFREIDTRSGRGKTKGQRSTWLAACNSVLFFLFLTIELCINWFVTSLQLLFHAAVILSCCNLILIQNCYGCLIALRLQKTSNQKISCSSLLTKRWILWICSSNGCC